MPGIVGSTVAVLNEVPSGTAAYLSADIAYDFAIGGVPFLSATSGENPYLRRTAPYRKEQQDQGLEPGEQSLVFWWLRSQSSFHGGAGQLFLDGQQASASRTLRFSRSLGCDVWTAGKVTLLRQCPLQNASANISALVPSGTNAVLHATDSTLNRTVIDGATAAVTTGAASTIQALTTDGSSYFLSTGTEIRRGNVDGSGAGVQAYTSAVSKLAFVKARLIAALNASLYELSSTASGVALPTAFYTHPTSGWRWTAFAEGPNGFYVAGQSGSKSAIYLVGLTSANPPTLAAPVQVAELPEGELVTNLYGYLGSFLAIGTTRGVRIAQIQSGGSITYGPLTLDVSLVSGGAAVSGFTGQDRFLYVGCNSLNGNGQAGLFRIDLSAEVDAGRYAYATDLQLKAALSVVGVTLVANRLVVGASGTGGGLFAQSATAFETSAFLETSRIRFSTSEPKLYKYLLIRGHSGDARIFGAVTDAAGTQTTATTFSTLAESSGEGAISEPPTEFLSVRIDITNNNTASTPEFNSYQLKALPAQKRQRLMVVPLLCFDFEMDRNRNRKGRPGAALAKLAQLEEYEESGDTVLFQHLTTDPEGRTSRLVVIDSIDFQQTAPPGVKNGWGGIIIATLRSVE